MKYRFALVALFAGLSIAVGCTPAAVEPGPTEPAAPETDVTATSAPVTTTPETAYPEPAALPATPAGYPAAPTSLAYPAPLSGGVVPQKLFDIVLDDLLAQTGGDSTAVTVLQAEAITWPDGSMGCPQPDTMYTQALVDGYRVVFGLGEETFDYHLDNTGTFILCDIPLPDEEGTQ